MKIIMTAAIIILLSGCAAQAIEKSQLYEATEERNNDDSTYRSVKFEEMDMHVTMSDYQLSLYEPPQGCYLGAYILSDKQVDFDIETFEDVTGTSHALYVYNMALGDYFPVNWVLSCITNMKTPYVVLRADGPLDAKGWETLEQTAISFGEFYVPMFVELKLPTEDVTPDSYTSDFIKARELFAEHASNVAFVWSVNAEDVYTCANYYPGDRWVDWVGISLMESLDPDRPYKGDVLEALDTFCGVFQQQKPIIVTRFAVSHLNSRDYVYHTDSAATEIRRVYGALSGGFGRVKAVLYMDFNGMDMAGEEPKDDFTVTREKGIIDAYRGAAAGKRFLNELDVASSGDYVPQEYKSSFTAYGLDGDYFIPENSLLLDFKIEEPLKAGDERLIGGERCVNVGDAGGLGREVSFEPRGRVINHYEQ